MSPSPKSRDIHGVLVIDKPRGPTSHDVVRVVRRALRTRAVGHAGTLDPMATGVLVVAVGEATKLVRWLTADEKHYRATLALGVETDTLDADGDVIRRQAVGVIDRESVCEASRGFVGRCRQRPPAYSAIKVDGVRLHQRARRGESVEVPERVVEVHRLEVLDVEPPRVEFEVVSGKGFYVRALGRDLARALGTCGHLTALRRLRSGMFGVEQAVDVAALEEAVEDAEARARLVARLRTPAEACGAMLRIVLSATQVVDARHGRPIRGVELPGGDADPVAMLDERGRLVAVGRSTGDQLRVVRGFAAPGRLDGGNPSSHSSEDA